MFLVLSISTVVSWVILEEVLRALYEAKKYQSSIAKNCSKINDKEVSLLKKIISKILIPSNYK